MFVPAVTIALVWATHRRTDWAWILQDLMGIALLLVMQHALRLPNIKVASLLLSLAFFYDIFWVFLSPFLFTSSVMITVATGGSTGESLPVLLRLPSLNDPLGSYAMLGLGDVALPGLFISYLLRFDYRMSLRGRRSYFLLASAGYFVGLLITDFVLIFTESGQPALLYLVPCTVGLVVLEAHRRDHLKLMWTSPGVHPESLIGEESCPP
jgi:signal peptide peptidase-like protein 2B